MSSSSLPASQSSSSSALNINPSVVTAIFVLSITIIASTCLCLILRFLLRRCGSSASGLHTHTHAHSTTVRDVSASSRFSSSRRVAPQIDDRALINSLPLFTFASMITGRNRASGAANSDCAVCLSKFEPQDELRLLPICCHAFHAECVDTWLESNQTKTCPLCRSFIFASEEEILSKVLAASVAEARHGSFRIEIGNVSRRRQLPSDLGASQHSSYSLGSFEYVIETQSEIPAVATRTRTVFEEKDGSTTASTAASNNNLAAEVGAGVSRSWLRDCVDRLSAAVSSRTLSFRSSGRFFGSDRRNDVAAGEYDVEANGAGEQITEMFRWFSGV